MRNRFVWSIWYRTWWSIYRHEPIPALWIIAGYGAKRRKDNRMDKRAKIIEELTKRGYEVEAYTWVERGAKREGIRFASGDIVLVESIIKESGSLLDAVETVISCIKDVGEDVDSELICHIISNLYIGLQKKSDGDNVTAETEFEGIEKFIYVRLKKNWSCRISHSLLKLLKISEWEAWKTAEKNTFAESEIIPWSELLPKTTWLDVEGMEEASGDVVTNTKKEWGASAILNKKALKKLIQKYGTNRFIVFPSSVHEMFLVPDDGDICQEELDAMVRENNLRIRPEERLADRAYFIEI